MSAPDQQVRNRRSSQRGPASPPPTAGPPLCAPASGRYWTVPKRWAPKRRGARATSLRQVPGCRLVQTSGTAQPLSAIHAVPRRVRSSSSLASRSDDGGKVETSSSPWVRWEMASVSAMRFSASSPAACQSGIAASARPAAVRWCASTSGSVVLMFGKRLLDHARDLGVQLLSAALQQRVISRVLHQRVLERVDRIRRRATTEGQSRRAQLRQGVIELGLRHRRDRGDQLVAEFAANRRPDLGDLLHRHEPIQPRHQRVPQRRRNGDGASGATILVMIACLLQLARLREWTWSVPRQTAGHRRSGSGSARAAPPATPCRPRAPRPSPHSAPG